MLNWNWNQYKAAGRHIASYAGGAVSMAVALHFITPDQAVDVNGNLKSIFTGLQQVGAGVAGIVAFLAPIYAGWKASHSASPKQEAISLVAAVPGTKIVTPDPVVASAPSPDIVSTTTAKVVTQ